MASAPFPLRPDLEGQIVQLTDRDGYRCQGFVERVDMGQRVLKLKDTISLETRRREPGVQSFAQSDIEDLEVIKGQPMRPAAPATPRSPQKQPDPNFETLPRYNRVSKPDRRGQNIHLEKLIHLDMPGLLEQKQVDPTPQLHVLELNPGQPVLIPEPEQDPNHMEGEKFEDRLVYEFRTVREVCWSDPDSPPGLKALPSRFYLVEKEPGDAWSIAEAAIKGQKMLGLSMQGQLLGREGKLSVISISTKEEVFLFDFVALPNLLDEGNFLRTLLESSTVSKVVHDSRQMADYLHHQHGFQLRNVYDTLAAHVTFVPWALYAGFMPRYAASHNNLVRNYLGVATRFLFFPHSRRLRQREDSAIWLQRPLLPQLQLGAVRNTMFLLDLQRQTRMCMNSAFRKATEALQSVVRDATPIEAEVMAQDTSTLPDGVRAVLPDWGPKASRVRHLGLLEQQERWIHNTLGQMDPNVIFSRDCLHQKRDFNDNY